MPCVLYISGYTTLSVSPFGISTIDFVYMWHVIEQLTMGKTLEIRSKPAMFNVWPCALLMVIEKHNFGEYWICLNWNSKLVGIILPN